MGTTTGEVTKGTKSAGGFLYTSGRGRGNSPAVFRVDVDWFCLPTAEAEAALLRARILPPPPADWAAAAAAAFTAATANESCGPCWRWGRDATSSPRRPSPGLPFFNAKVASLGCPVGLFAATDGARGEVDLGGAAPEGLLPFLGVTSVVARPPSRFGLFACLSRETLGSFPAATLERSFFFPEPPRRFAESECVAFFSADWGTTTSAGAAAGAAAATAADAAGAGEEADCVLAAVALPAFASASAGTVAGEVCLTGFFFFDRLRLLGEVDGLTGLFETGPDLGASSFIGISMPLSISCMCAGGGHVSRSSISFNLS
jgi:hypothetical protein